MIEGDVRKASAVAAALLARGLHPVPLYPIDEVPDGEGKRPIGKGWGLERPTLDTLRRAYALRPRAGLGVCLGPGRGPGGRWLIDVEGDGPRAESSFLELTGGEVVDTAGWTSRRGVHRLFVVGDDFLDLLRAAGAVEGKGGKVGVYHLDAFPDLEFRVGGLKPDGTVKQVQSACPPTPDAGGTPRRWAGGRSILGPPPGATAKLREIAERARTRADRGPTPPARGPAPTASSRPASGDAGGRRDRYARAAFERELAELAATGEGGRNRRLNVAAMKLGQLAAAGAIGEDEAVAGLLEACRANGYGDGPDAMATIRSGMEKGKSEPRDLSGVGGPGRPRRPPPPAGPGRAAPPPPGAGEGPPVVEVTPREKEVNDAVLAALAGDPELYRFGFVLATVLEEGEAPRGVEYEGPPPPQVRPIPAAVLRERIAHRATLVKARRRGEVEELAPTHPPDWCVSAIHQRGAYPGFRPLEGVVEAPTIRRDGSILDAPGYDPATRLLFRPNARFEPIPASPTRADAEAARDLTLDLVCDFPFRGEADRALWLAALLTALARTSFAGPAPLFGFDGNCPGAGKTMLADLISILATGRPIPKMAFPGGRNGDEEMDKRITSIALAGERLTLIDNVPEPLGGAALDAALTTTSWRGRILGRSEVADVPLNVTWMASGNNLQCRGDLLRRALFARLESPVENPEERRGFKHPDLLALAAAGRGRLVSAALTILRAHQVAGRPSLVSPLGSFEGWTRAIADAVAWIVGVDPLEVRKSTKAEDQGANARNALMAGWAELPGSERGLTVAEAYKLLKAVGHEDRFGTLRAALMELSPNGELPSPRSLGRHLTALKGRVMGSSILRGDSNRLGVMAWRVEKDDGSAGFAGFETRVQGLDFGKPSSVKTMQGNGFESNAGFAGFKVHPFTREEEISPDIRGEILGEGAGNKPCKPCKPSTSPDREVFEL